MERNLPKPDKTRCMQCGQSESPNRAHRRCAKCRTVPYCSVECQKANWKSHKQVCPLYVMDGNMDCAGIYVGQKQPKAKKGEIRRTRGQILNDLTVYANSHNGETLTLSAWNLLELTRDISRAKTHFLAVTLRRTDSSDPRTLYSLADAEVLPLSFLEVAYVNRTHVSDMSPVRPRLMLANDAEQRILHDGALGSVMVVSIELPKGDNSPPRKALKELVVHTLQPLGLFKVHQDALSRLPPLPKDYYMKCLKNGLDGGAYCMKFQPFTPLNN